MGLLISGLRALKMAKRVPFFRVRRREIGRSWRSIFFALCLFGLAIFFWRGAEPLAYRYYPPSSTPSRTPTITQTPTITLSPTITLTPTITNTPAETYTPTPTLTPFIPMTVEMLFESLVTPNPEAIFSPLQFTRKVSQGQAVKPATVFNNPVGHLYAVFSYDKMSPGAQWTALWYYGERLVHFETKPWDGEVGGWGYTDWNPSPEEWLPGMYRVVIFVGLEWKVSGEFEVRGEPRRETSTPTASPTASRTPRPTDTRWPSPTYTSTPTPSPTRTPRPTDTPR